MEVDKEISMVILKTPDQREITTWINSQLTKQTIDKPKHQQIQTS